MQNLALVGHTCVKAYDASEKYGVNEFQENAHQLQKIIYSGIIPFVYVGKKEILKFMRYKVSMTTFMARIANQRKILKWLPFKNYKPESLNI